MSRFTRRAFLRKLALSSSGRTETKDTHALVCVFLRGGADTLNMFVPYADDRYYQLRPTIAIKPPEAGVADVSIKLNDFYALHPKMEPLLPIFKEGRLGVVQSVGSDNSSGSHFEAQDQMEHGESYGKTIGGGWLGRHLQCLSCERSTPLSAVAIGPAIPESLRGAPSVSAITSVDEIKLDCTSGNPHALAAALSLLYRSDVSILSQPGRATLDLLDRVERLRGTHYREEGKASYPQSDFGGGMREIARLIKSRVGLEVACIDLNGWDTHFIQGSSAGLQADNIDQLSRALAAFDQDLVQFRSSYTVLVMTEFGRRVYENGSLGTDHGRGFAAMAMGESVNGGTVYGAWPGLDGESDLLGPSGLKISYDYRSVFSEVLSGATSNHRLSSVFPGFGPESIGLIKGAVVPIA